MVDYTENPDTIFIGQVKSCKHYFHFYCLWEWLERDTSCPLCRNTVNFTESDIKGVSLSEVLQDMEMDISEKCKSNSPRDLLQGGFNLTPYDSSICSVHTIGKSSGNSSQIHMSTQNDAQSSLAVNDTLNDPKLVRY